MKVADALVLAAMIAAIPPPRRGAQLKDCQRPPCVRPTFHYPPSSEGGSVEGVFVADGLNLNRYLSPLLGGGLS